MGVYASTTDTTFNDVNDTLVYQPIYTHSTIQITATDADQQTIFLQVEQGAIGSGSWRTIKKFVGVLNVNATIDYTFFHRSVDRVRLFLFLDDGGTNTVVINEMNHNVATFEGNGVKLPMDKFASDSGLFRAVVDTVAETATFTATVEKHSNRTTTLDASGGALTITLPSSTGTLNWYRFVSIVDPGSNDIVISCDTDGGFYTGAIHVSTDGSAPTPFSSDQTANDLITLNNTTTGALIVGDSILCTDVGTNVWLVWGQVTSSGGEATPFSGS